MDLVLQRAEKNDFNKINELFKEMRQSVYNLDNAKGYECGDLDRYFTNQEDWVCIVKHKDNIIAFLSIEVHREDKEYLYLNDLCVTNKYRNNGIGTKLIATAEEYAKRVKVKAVCLHVEKSNTKAFNLYERLGYKIFSQKQNRYLMVKNI